MEKQRRFQNQKLNSEDYQKEERAAKLTKTLFALSAVAIPVGKFVQKNGIKPLKTLLSSLKY